MFSAIIVRPFSAIIVEPSYNYLMSTLLSFLVYIVLGCFVVLIWCIIIIIIIHILLIFLHILCFLNLSLNELKLVARSRGIKGYKSMSNERLLNALSELVESKNSFGDERLKKIREDFNELRDRFLKLQVKEIRKNLYDIKNLKHLSTQKIKEIEKYLFKLEKSLSNVKKYRSQDENLRDVGNLLNEFSFNQSIDEDYYKPVKTTNVFDSKNNYIEYESKGDKSKNLSVKNTFV